MKLNWYPTITATLLYFILTGATFEDEAATDGFTRIGFPFYFYTNSGGKFLVGYRPVLGFNTIHFLVDLLTLTLIIIVANKVYSRYTKRNIQKGV